MVPLEAFAWPSRERTVEHGKCLHARRKRDRPFRGPLCQGSGHKTHIHVYGSTGITGGSEFTNEQLSTVGW